MANDKKQAIIDDKELMPWEHINNKYVSQTRGTIFFENMKVANWLISTIKPRNYFDTIKILKML